MRVPGTFETSTVFPTARIFVDGLGAGLRASRALHRVRFFFVGRGGNGLSKRFVSNSRSPNGVVYGDQKMKAAHLLATAALAFMPASAHAYLLCSNPVQTIGATGSNPVVQTYVGLSDDRSWSVVHTLADGTMIDRAKQYSMRDATDRTKIGWRGRLNAVQHLWMEGRIMVRAAAGGKVYVENLYNEDKGNALVMHSETDCRRPRRRHECASRTDRLPPRSRLRNPPRESDRGGRGIDRGAPVLRGERTTELRGRHDRQPPDPHAVGHGRTEMSVTDTAAHTLVDKREASWGANIMAVLADNTTRDTRTILIDRVVIGGKIITNVRAYVVPDGSDMLLGMGVLGRFGKFSIDTVNGRLTLG